LQKWLHKTLESFQPKAGAAEVSGERTTNILSLIETCRLSGFDPSDHPGKT
jgi:hypothetical protein